jgi:hypothetical protein
MQKTWLALVILILAVAVSTGISYLLWGQHSENGGAQSPEVRIKELEAEVAKIENDLRRVADSQPERVVTFGEFDLALSRIEDLERRERMPRISKAGRVEAAESGSGEPVGDVAEQKIRQVYQDIKDEERRAREEERQRQREQQRREREEYLAGVYDNHIQLLTKELSLTPNQETGVRQALDARKQSMMKMYDSWGLSREERRQRGVPEWEEVNKTYDNTVKQVLSQEQYTQYKRKGLDDFSGRSRRGRRGR